MLKSYDVGSTPDKPNSQNKVIDIFIDKLRAGIDIPKYSQLRDMNEMFLGSMDGIKKVNDSYTLEGPISISPEKAKIKEVQEIEEKSKLICEETGKPFSMGICITGPYDLSFRFPQAKGATRYWLFQELGDIISKIVESNVFNNKRGKVTTISIDEPSFGTFDDSEVCIGSDGREYLLKVWENISKNAKSRGTDVAMHLHATGDKLPWEVDSLKIIGSHVDDRLYEREETKKLLEEKDKFLNASIAKTNFDDLVRNELLASGADEMDVGQKAADIWKDIDNGKVNPSQFVESLSVLKKRLDNIINRFGVERVPYAGPECGLKSFPSYESAIETLRRVSQAAHSY
jgi:5-methyltetrahydropteroyltriglutamate--homocysteine methyltransferase